MAQIVKEIVIALCREMEHLRREENREDLMITVNLETHMEIKNSIDIVGPVNWVQLWIAGVPFVEVPKQKQPFRIWKLVR